MGQMSLFSESSHWKVISTRGADIDFYPSFLSERDATLLFQALIGLPGWHQDQIYMFGKTLPLPRLHRWFADAQQPYCWSGIAMHPEPFPPILEPIRRQILDVTGIGFNTALANLYRNGFDSVSWHADDEPDLGDKPVIASLSLGTQRRFMLRRKDDRTDRLTLSLSHGSLLVMSGNTQIYWEHSVPKSKTVSGPRINLTFRAIRKNPGSNSRDREGI